MIQTEVAWVPDCVLLSSSFIYYRKHLQSIVRSIMPGQFHHESAVPEMN